MDSANTHFLWWVAAAGGAVYALLFILARRPVALRVGRLGWLLLAVFVVRLGLLLMGYPLATWPDASLAGTAMLGAICCRLGTRIWLVRGGADDLRQQIETACRGLFLVCQEPQQGRFLLTAKGRTRRLQVLRIGRRLQFVVVPRPGGQGKVRLLVNWLSKQYPSAVPRLHIVLRKE